MKTRDIDAILDRSIEMAKCQLATLEKLKEANSHMSGNDTETVLECMVRIANNEPENSYYNSAVQHMTSISKNVEVLRELMMCSVDDTYGLANALKVYNYKTMAWFHDEGKPVAN